MRINLYALYITLPFILFTLFSCSMPTENNKSNLANTETGTNGGNTGRAQWAKSTFGTSSDSLLNGGLSVDANGNIYAGVNISGTGSCNFGNSVIVTKPNSESCGALLKYNDSGEVQWAKAAISGTGRIDYTGLRTDSAGNTYVAGIAYGSGSYSFGNNVQITGGNSSQSAFIIKYSSLGIAQWANTSKSGSIPCYFYDVDFDSYGNCYVVGLIYGTGDCDFGNGVILKGLYSGPNSSYNCVLVKYNANGQAVWGRALVAATKNSNYRGISLDQEGNIYIVGEFGNGTFNFGNSITRSLNLNSNGVLVKYSNDGNILWVQTLNGGGSSSAFSGLAVDPAGNCFIAGYISSLSNFGNNVSATSTLYLTAFVAKYNSNGLAQWANSTQFAKNDSSFTGISIDKFGNSYAVGSISGSQGFDFGNDVNAVGPYNYNSLLVKYDSKGIAQWARSVNLGAQSMSYFYNTKTAINGDLLVSGRIDGKSLYGFGNQVSTLGASTNINAVLVKYN